VVYNNNVKKLLILLVVIISGYFLFTIKGGDGYPLLSYSRCDTPLTYRIGTIDPRFNLTADETLATVGEAAALWNSAWLSPIFMYDPKGEIVISLDYDERQMLSSQINEIQTDLDTGKTSLDPKINAYKNHTAEFDKKMATLNADIAYWNGQGGAPQDVFNQLKDRQTALRLEAESLNDEAADLNQSTKSYNFQIKTLNQTIGMLDKTLVSKPEEGIYNPNNNSISIYFNNSKAELVHTIAHELGHARDLDHLPDPTAIMYSSSTKITTLSPDDLTALNKVCEKRSVTELYWNTYFKAVRGIRGWFLTTISQG